MADLDLTPVGMTKPPEAADLTPVGVVRAPASGFGQGLISSLVGGGAPIGGTTAAQPPVPEPLEPHTTIPGVMAAAGRGLAPIATGAALGAAAGAPLAGVGAIPGAAAGAGAVISTELAESLYNPLAQALGWPRMATPQEMTDRVLDYIGVKRPSTGIEKTVETTAGGAAGAAGLTRAAGRMAETAAEPVLRGVAGKLAERPGLQAVSGAAGGMAGGAAAAAGFGPVGQTVAGLIGGGIGGAAGGIDSAIAHYRLTPAEQATNVIAHRLATDAKHGGPTAEEAIQQVADWRKAGKPFTLRDVGGSNIRALSGHIARKGGEARAIVSDALESRAAGGAPGERLSKDVTTYLTDGASAFVAKKALLDARSQAARPLYAEAEALQGIWSPRLQEFLNEPRVKAGLRRGYELERLDALAENRPFDPTQMGVDLDQEGNVVLLRVPNVRVLDMGKRGLDAMIAENRDDTGRLTALGRSLAKVNQAYVREIDGLDTSGIYAKARSAWAGPSKSLDALNFGETIFKRTPEETAAEFAEMSPGDQEFVRMGVASALRESLLKAGFGTDASRRIIRNPWMRQQLAPVFKTEQSFDKFVDAVDAEHTMAATRNDDLKGAQTAERVATDMQETAGLARHGAGLLHHAVSGNILGTMRHGLSLASELALPSEKLYTEIAKQLFSPEPRLPTRKLPDYLSPAVGTIDALLGSTTQNTAGQFQ